MEQRTTAQNFDLMVKRLVERFDPQRIILFGLHARATAGPDRGDDLLIIMPVTNSKRKK
jgi:hypothetical protein